MIIYCKVDFDCLSCSHFVTQPDSILVQPCLAAFCILAGCVNPGIHTPDPTHFDRYEPTRSSLAHSRSYFGPVGCSVITTNSPGESGPASQGSQLITTFYLSWSHMLTFYSMIDFHKNGMKYALLVWHK